MKVLNHLYQDQMRLCQFIENEHIPNKNSVLIQLFSSKVSDGALLSVREELKELLPQCQLIGSSTAGIVKDGEIVDDAINVSFSIFEHSIIKSKGYRDLTADEILEQLSKELITKKTKLLLFFANTFTLDSEEILSKLQQKHPSLIVAGENGADDFKFQSCNIFSQIHERCDAAFAAIDSDVLDVQTASLLNWQSIGKELTVTKVDATRLYELDNKPVLEMYEHYFGKEIKDKILSLVTQFPLIYKNNEIDIARAPIAVHNDGSLTLAGKLKEGMQVKFCFANISAIEAYNNEQLLKQYPYKMEAVYI